MSTATMESVTNLEPHELRSIMNLSARPDIILGLAKHLIKRKSECWPVFRDLARVVVKEKGPRVLMAKRCIQQFATVNAKAAVSGLIAASIKYDHQEITTLIMELMMRSKEFAKIVRSGVLPFGVSDSSAEHRLSSFSEFGENYFTADAVKELANRLRKLPARGWQLNPIGSLSIRTKVRLLWRDQKHRSILLEYLNAKDDDHLITLPGGVLAMADGVWRNCAPLKKVLLRVISNNLDMDARVPAALSAAGIGAAVDWPELEESIVDVFKELRGDSAQKEALHCLVGTATTEEAFERNLKLVEKDLHCGVPLQTIAGVLRPLTRKRLGRLRRIPKSMDPVIADLRFRLSEYGEMSQNLDGILKAIKTKIYRGAHDEVRPSVGMLDRHATRVDDIIPLEG